MCGSLKSQHTSTSRKQYPTGATQLSTRQYESFAQVANSAFDRREAKKTLLLSREIKAISEKTAVQNNGPQYLLLYIKAKEKILLLFAWLHLSSE